MQISTSVIAQVEIDLTHPKRDVRAAWVTYMEIPGRSRSVQQWIWGLRDAGVNVVYFHARAFSDAFYNSNIEPWSDQFNGSQGSDPGFDPLQVALEEAHKFGMELHAWVNPFRSHSTSNLPLADNHIYNKHPEWVMEFDVVIGGKNKKEYIINPGIQEARGYVIDVVKDIISRYDVDGIVYDDYFYPYPDDDGYVMNNTADQAAFEADPRGFTGRSDWRRDNTRKFIKATHDAVLTNNEDQGKQMVFGVSPFGVYKRGVHGISNNNTLDSYNDIYIDPVAWLQDGSIDYLAPQLYWEINSRQQYNILAKWWDNKLSEYGRYHFAGMNTVPVAKGKWSLTEMSNQIKINRSSDNMSTFGQAFYNSSNVQPIEADVVNHLLSDVYKYPSVPPVMTWINDIAPNNVTNVSFDGNTVTWSEPVATDEGIVARKYIIYAFDESDNISVQKNNGTKIIGVTGETSFTVDAMYADKVLAISALDAVNNESLLATEDGALRIEDNEAVVLVNSVYPNPVSDNGLNIELIETDVKINVMSIEGRLVYSGVAHSKIFTVDTQSWNKGMYLVMISTGNQKQVIKVIKE
ncbi:MAG: family 10 glycosylhydrolase [Chlamydiia bacterium]|nr:family 10 glycosylhydrolase [Chlamydiia bacterium]